ncbi:hypothetical protein NMG60_11006755 [Bertholletia excelsa]
MSVNQTAERNWGQMITCDKLDWMANWVGDSVTSAFFASLERCFCINLSTSHDNVIKDDEEAQGRLFMHRLAQPIALDNQQQQPVQFGRSPASFISSFGDGSRKQKTVVNHCDAEIQNHQFNSQKHL